MRKLIADTEVLAQTNVERIALYGLSVDEVALVEGTR